MFLFLLGLLTGLLETHFINIRMGVSAHLEGVMNANLPGWAGRRAGRVWNASDQF
jgi:hypothetical protein